jgi:hypothetical protein
MVLLKRMSRSFHVTRRASIRAFAEGDTAPAADASDKSGVKKKEKLARRLASAFGHRRKNSAIVSSEKALTKRVESKRENMEV